MKSRSSFVFLNLTQFFSALNDNIYKLLLVFQLINIQGIESSNTILAMAGAIFVIPFILFASLAGTLADRFSKRSIICLTRLTEIGVVAAGVMAFSLKSPFLGYLVLFLMATQSAILSPAKYGIIPEIVPKQRVSKYNGIITATTYLAIISGTFFASFLADITDKNFVFASTFCLLIALLGALTSLGIEKTAPQARQKKISFHFVSDIYRTLKRARNIRYLLPAIIFGAYFLFLGAYTQLNIIPFSIQSLGQSEIEGGYLFLMTALGIGIGSFFAGRISGKEVELGIVPLAAGVISLLLISLYFFASHFVPVVLLLIFLGFFGGFYIVPIDSFIQLASPSQDRGENVAASNFLNFIGVVIASSLIALFGNSFGLLANEGFLFVGLLSLLLSVLLFMIMGDQVFRFFLGKVSRFWNIKVKGERKFAQEAVLITGERRSWLDTVIMMAILPRLIRYIVPIEGRFIRPRKLVYRALRMTPVHKDLFFPIDPMTLKEILYELEAGHSVCLMYPDTLSPALLQKFENKIDSLLKKIDVSRIQVEIERPERPKMNHLAQFFTLFSDRLRVSFSE